MRIKLYLTLLRKRVQWFFLWLHRKLPLDWGFLLGIASLAAPPVVEFPPEIEAHLKRINGEEKS